MAAAKQHSTVVGVFQDRQQANKAVSELLKAGFRQDQIGVAMRHAEGEVGATTTAEGATTTAEAEGSHAGSGALGACLGISIQVTSMDDQSVQIASIRPQCSFAPIPAA